jgi:hypothetical protein
MKSIQTYGWTTPILVTDGLEVIAGHGRLLAAQKLGIESVPCIRLSHLTPALVKAYRIADNRLTLDSDWDDEVLASVLLDLRADPIFDLALTGFEGIEIDSRLGINGHDADSEWDGMPEFNQADKTAYRSIVVHFKEQCDVEQFALRIDANITDKTRFIWFPKIEIETYVDKRYQADDPVDES